MRVSRIAMIYMGKLNFLSVDIIAKQDEQQIITSDKKRDVNAVFDSNDDATHLTQRWGMK